jgi:DNA-binding PucR family transcriptional regulator
VRPRQRQTLYYRLAKIEEITGLSLSVGAQRLELHIGLTLGRFLVDEYSGGATGPPD